MMKSLTAQLIWDLPEAEWQSGAEGDGGADAQEGDDDEGTHVAGCVCEDEWTSVEDVDSNDDGSGQAAAFYSAPRRASVDQSAAPTLRLSDRWAVATTRARSMGAATLPLSPKDDDDNDGGGERRESGQPLRERDEHTKGRG